MRTRFVLPLYCLLLTTLFACMTTLTAHAVTTISLHANKSALLADGKQQAELFVTVQGNVVSNSEVTFTTTKGTLRESRVRFFGGSAHTTLTSAPIAGYADVTAFVNGAASNTLRIEFTDDPEATFEGNNYILITGKGYLAYSANDKIIEAEGRDGGAHLSFRNYDLTADRIQLECNDVANIRATGNITLKRGKDVVHATKLHYSLQSEEGQAIGELDGKIQPITVTGAHLLAKADPAPAPSSRYIYPELSVKLIITARSITYFPGDRLQFRAPNFFQDQAKILTLPYYEIGLNSDELFSDHFVSVGTNGFGLEVPFYYNLSPRGSGIAYLRHGQQIGRSYFATDPGWAVDVIQGYNSQGDKHVEGAYGFTGLLRGDWGFRWTHNQEFDPTTQGSMYIDFPHHDSVYANTSLSKQTNTMRFGINATEGQSFTSDGENTFHNDAYAETLPHKLFGSKDVQYVFGGSFNTSRLTSHLTTQPDVNDTSEQLTMRAFTRPLKLDTRTTLTNSFTFGQLWNGRANTGLLGLATMSLDHTVKGGGSINLTYDYLTRPQSSLDTGGKHRMSLNFNVANTKKFQMSIFGSTFLDAQDTSVLADAAYRLNNDWRLLTSATLQRFEGQSYSDLEFTLGRRIGARELQLTYSTFNHRISFDLTATRF